MRHNVKEKRGRAPDSLAAYRFFKAHSDDDNAFPGRAAAVRFGFDFAKPPTPKEVFEIAAVAKQAGWSIDQAQLEEQTGYTLVKDEQLPAGGLTPSSPAGGLPLLNKAPEPVGSARRADREDTDVLAAFAKDTTPAAEAVRALLDDPTPEKAKALMDRLPELLPEDPALASVIAEEMAKEFGTVAANKTDANGADHAEAGSGNGGQFVAKDGGTSGTPSEKTEKKSPQTAEDYRKLADGISKERIAQICTADTKQQCKIEEAIAVLRTNPKVTNALGEEVTFGYDMAEKYLTGRFRSGNAPKPENLKDLQIAMYAVKHDKTPKLQYLRGAIHDPLNPPRGTQRVYTVPASEGPMLARAWADSGKVTGWYVETKKPTGEGGGRKRAKKA